MLSAEPRRTSTSKGRTLEISLLGEPHLDFCGESLEFAAPPKTLPLLAYMLLHRERSLNRETVATTMWPDAPQDETRANLRRHLHYLKKALPQRPADSPWFLVDFRRIKWNVQTPFRLDVDRFAKHSAASGGEREAVRLYRGDLLQRFDDEWLTYHRERLRNLHFSNLSRLINFAEIEKDYQNGLAFIRLLLEVDPWREDAVRSLIRFKHLSGDRSGALAEYDRFRQRLKVEMDVEPMSQTTELYRSLSGAYALAPDENPARPALTGREVEIEVLKTFWQHAIQHRGGLLLIGGEAGMGKSRLLSALLNAATESGGQCYIGHTSAATESPYQSIVEILRNAATHIDFKTMRSTTSHYARMLLPEFIPAEHLKLGALSHFAIGEPDQLPFFAAISDILEALSNRKPLLVCFEDLHWAGNTTIALLGFLVRRLHGKAVAFAGTYRDEEMPPNHPLRQLRRQLRESKLMTLLPLSPLSKEATALIMQRSLPSDSLQTNVNDLHERSGDNPFFLGELLRNINESGSTEFPSSIQDLVGLRLDRLSKSARSIAQSAAVIGRSFTTELLLQLTGLPEGQIVRAISELVSRHIVRESANSGEEYVFSHYVIQATIYDGLDTRTRRRKHSRLAFLLESGADVGGSTNQRALAWHFERAEMKQHAATAYVLAAQQALNTYANAEAERYASRTLELAAMPPLKIKALLVMEEVYKRSGDTQRQASALALLEALSLNVDEIDLQCETLARRIEYCTMTGAGDESIKLLRSTGNDGPLTASWRGRFLLLEARVHRDAAGYDDAATAAERALALFEGTQDKAAQFDTYLLLIQLTFQGGKDWRTFLERARSMARSTTDLHSACRLAYEEYMILRSTSAPAAYDAASNMLELALQTGDRRFECRAQLGLAELSIWRFEIDRARQHLRAGENLARDVGQTEDRLKVLRMQALLELLLGRFPAARELLMQALQQANIAGNIPVKVAALNTIAYAYLNEGKPQKAGEFLNRAREVTENYNVPIFESDVFSNLAEYYAQLGQDDKAIATFEKSLKLCRQLGKSQMQPGQMAEIMLMYLGAGDIGKAHGVLDDLLPLMGDADSGWQPQQAYWAVSCMYHALNDRPRAVTYLKRAYALVCARARKIPDQQSQESYLAIAFNAAIVRACKDRTWPKLSGKLTLLH